jgi:hypothetical protein
MTCVNGYKIVFLKMINPHHFCKDLMVELKVVLKNGPSYSTLFKTKIGFLK